MLIKNTIEPPNTPNQLDLFKYRYNNCFKNKLKKIQKETENLYYELFIALAKTDHVVFKINGYEKISKQDQEKMSDHHSCRLGKWYQGDGREIFGSSEIFKQLDKPHSEVHKLINDSLAINNDEGLIAQNFQKAEEASRTLFNLFDKMLKERLHRLN